MIAHRETHPEWSTNGLGHRLLTALLMALVLLLLYALVDAAAAAIIDVPAGLMSAAGFVGAVGCLLFALLAPSLRAAWGRLTLVGGILALALGTPALIAATWSDGAAGPLPIEIPWSLQGTWNGLIRSTLIAVAIVALGIALLIAAYALHRKRDDRASMRYGP